MATAIMMETGDEPKIVDSKVMVFILVSRSRLTSFEDWL
jgi:hypothetical protein